MKSVCFVMFLFYVRHVHFYNIYEVTARTRVN
jgi:hypothetical protein